MVEGERGEAGSRGRAPRGSAGGNPGVAAADGRAGRTGERSSPRSGIAAHCGIHSVFGAAPGGAGRARSSGGQSAALIRPRPLVRVQARPPAEPSARRSVIGMARETGDRRYQRRSTSGRLSAARGRFRLGP